MERWAAVEADFQRFYGLHPFDLSWRRFRTLIFSLVSSESAFYAPYLKEYVEEAKERVDSRRDNPNRIKVNLDTALDELGGIKENISFNNEG